MNQFRKTGALVRLIYMFLDQENYPQIVVEPLISLFKSILHKEPTEDELEKINQYLLASHNSDIVVAPTRFSRKNSDRKIRPTSMVSGTLSRKTSSDFEDSNIISGSKKKKEKKKRKEKKRKEKKRKEK